MLEAKDVLEDVIIRHNSGLPLDVNTRKSFHLTLWEQAAAAMDVGCGLWGVGVEVGMQCSRCILAPLHPVRDAVCTNVQPIPYACLLLYIAGT